MPARKPAESYNFDESREVTMQFLLIARVVEGVRMEQVMPHVKDEAAKVWEEYTADVSALNQLHRRHERCSADV